MNGHARRDALVAALMLAARLIAAAVFLLTWAYGVTTHSAFAFDMFVKPQLSPALTSFVTWHPAWFVMAVVLSAVTLVPAIRRGPQPARLLAAGYIAVLGAVAVWLSGRAYLASLTGGAANLLVVPGALVPILWLAAVDHLGRRDDSASGTAASPLALWHATTAAAIVLWLSHVAWSWTSTRPTIGAMAWAGLLDVGLAQLVFLGLAAASKIAGANRRTEYWIAVALLGAAISASVASVVLPTLGFSSTDRLVIAIPFGITIALMVSGLRWSRGACIDDGATALLAAPVSRRTAIALTLIALGAATIATAQTDRFDWMFVGRQLVAIVEAVVVFALVMTIVGTRRTVSTSTNLVVGIAVVLAGVLAGVPRLTAMPSAIEEAISLDPLARVAATAFIPRRPPDTEFTRHLIDLASATWSMSPAVAAGAAETSALTASPLPNVFVIVLDSLRRDYLSPYNPAVTFTPNIDRWARESFVFTNAFTQYGGTALAMPSLWAGRGVPHGWAQIMPRINRLETLIVNGRFDFLINDHTVREHLRPETKYTFLNPYVASPQTDLCQNVAAFETHVRSRTTTQPLFTFLAPMNVHILNTRVGTGTESYPGFHAPYAAQLEKADACFGNFIGFLTAQGLYDNSIIVLTSDHGDSVGEGGRWGHQSFLYPEIVRIPMIVSLPARMRASVTTDRDRIALLADVTPTLMSLLGNTLVDADLPEGSSLFAPAGSSPSRQRDAVMLMSSYGPVFGVVRGQQMYMTDLQNWREQAFTLEKVGYRHALVTDTLRQASQAEILRQTRAVEQLYSAQ